MRPAPGAGRGATQPPGRSPSAGPKQPQSEQPARQERTRGPQSNIPATLNDQTIRMVVHTSIGGHRVRVEISNAIGGAELMIGAAYVAIRAKESEIVARTDRVLTISGSRECGSNPES